MRDGALRGSSCGPAVVRGGKDDEVPSASLEAVEDLVEGAVVDAAGAIAVGLERAGDGEAVHGVPAQGLDDKDVEGALEEGQGGLERGFCGGNRRAAARG